MKKSVKIFAVLLLVAVLIMQFIRPEKNESGYDAIVYFENETKSSDQISSILKSNCYDCHSNQTNYPWYAEVAPVSYWLSHHVDEGKEHFNVSDWKQYSVEKKDHKLEEFIEEVEEGEMPLNSYTWVHGNLNEEEKQLIIRWAKELREQYAAH